MKITIIKNLLMPLLLVIISQPIVAMQKEKAPLHAANHSLTTDEDRPISGSLKGLVSGGRPPYTFSNASGYIHDIRIEIKPDGSFVFTPFNNFFGGVNFRYQATDADGTNSNIGTVQVYVEEQ